MTSIPNLRGTVLFLALTGILILSGLACDLPVTISSETPTIRASVATMVPTRPPAATLPPSPADTSTAPPPKPTQTQPPPAVEVREVQIYLVAVGDGGKGGKVVGCGDSLMAVRHTVAPTRQPIVAALNDLFAIKEQFLGQSGLYNALYQSTLKVESAEIDSNHIATVVLSGPVMMGGECDTPRFKAQIEQTILGVGGIQSANIILNGKTIDQALSLK